MSHPKDFLGNELLSTFGMREFEWAIRDIIKWLASDSHIKMPVYLDYGNDGEGWDKLFAINTFPEIDASMFAMLCAAGWIENTFFPKGTFKLSRGAIKRLEASICQHPNRVTHSAGDPFEECTDCNGYMLLRDGLWRHKGGVVQHIQPPMGLSGLLKEEGWETAGKGIWIKPSQEK